MTTAKRFTHKINQLGMQFICYDDKAELLGTFADADGVTHIVKLLNELHEENQRLIKMLDNVANYMQKQHKDMPIDDFVEWWNNIATEGLEND